MIIVPTPPRVRVVRHANRLAAETDPYAFRDAVMYELALQRDRVPGALSLCALFETVLLRRWPGTRTPIPANQR